MTFGKRIEQARELAGLSKWDLAHFAGVDVSYIKKIEVEGYIPSAKTTEALARALDLPVSEMLILAGFVPPMSPNEWESILLDLRASSRLQPELRAALRGLQGFTRDELRDADAMLLGLARGFQQAREQRASQRASQRRRAS